MGGGATRRAMVRVLVAGLCAACGGATGSPSTPPPEPGPVGAGSGSPGPGPANGAWDPASLDPRIDVSPTGAPSCAGVGPRDPAPAPVRTARPSSTSCGFGGATSDGRGDVAVACLDGRGDRGWNEVFSRDGSQRTTLSAWTLAAPTGAGFTAAYTPFGLRTARQQFVWFDGASWQAASDPDTSAPARFVYANPGAGILEVAWRDASGAGATTRWVDASGNIPSSPRASGAGGRATCADPSSQSAKKTVSHSGSRAMSVARVLAQSQCSAPWWNPPPPYTITPGNGSVCKLSTA